MPEIDQATAAALGWPKAKYAWIERERRWLCEAVPFDRVVRAETLTDLYVTGTQLRLREAFPTDGGPPMRRLGRKADVNPSVRLLTSIYLSPEEFRLLSSLPGHILRKTRHYLGDIAGADVSVDVFEGALSGLIMAEAEFGDAGAMATYPMPDFAFREVTDDIRYTGEAGDRRPAGRRPGIVRRAFIAEAMSRATEAALTRRPDAVRVVSGWRECRQ